MDVITNACPITEIATLTGERGPKEKLTVWDSHFQTLSKQSLSPAQQPYVQEAGKGCPAVPQDLLQ